MTPYLPKNTLTRLAPTLGCQPYKLHHGVHGDNKLRPRLTSEEQPCSLHPSVATVLARQAQKRFRRSTGAYHRVVSVAPGPLRHTRRPRKGTIDDRQN